MPTSSRKKNRFRFPFLFIFIGIILLAVVFLIYKKQTAQPPAIQDTAQHAGQAPEPETGGLTASQEEEIPEYQASDNTTAAGQEIGTAASQVDECAIGSERISLFLSHLSEQEYIKAYGIDEKLSDYLNKIIIKLLNNPPVITSESNDLLSILKNAAHFYRVLGPKDVSLIKDILIYEGEGLESILAEFYHWSLISDACPNSQIRFSMPLKKSYEYSCFFLNTLGGQSYLFRRESRSRILIRYYAILILDRAMQSGLNQYNFSPESSLLSTLEDLQEAHFLINKDLYIKNLLDIQKRLPGTVNQ